MNLENLKKFIFENHIVKDGIYSSNYSKRMSDEIIKLLFDLTPNCKGTTRAERVYWIVNDLDHYPKSCKNCKVNKVTIWEGSKSKYDLHDFCSLACSSSYPETQAKINNTNMKRHGVKRPLQNRQIHSKMKKTNLEKYGAEEIFSNESSIKPIIKKHFIEKYGVDSPLKSKAIREKIKKTNLARYGHEWATQHDGFMKNLIIGNKKRLKDKYGVENTSHLHLTPKQMEILNSREKFTHLYHEIGRQELFLKLGVSLGTFCYREIQYGVRQKYESSNEVFVKKLLDGENVIQNSRKIIPPKELDFYLPDCQLAIEVDGIYWHSEIGGEKDKNYHLDKTEMCIKQDIKLLHLWENEIHNQWPIVQSRIKSQLNLNEKIPARKCQVKQVDHQVAKSFFDQTHIQGHVNSKICYGLYLEGELVACMSFTKSRFNKKFEWEILRYSSGLNTNVIGGASKLFAHFIKIHDPNSIITYADRRWGEGKFYEKLGFSFSHSSKPNYFYTQDYLTLHSRNEFQKHKLKNKLAEFNPELTKWSNMQNNGWDRIWDCGNNVYHWTKS